jgi:hypothetical protein
MTWLKYESFITLIKENWTPFDQRNPLSATFQFVDNLKKIKEKVKIWDFQKRQREDQELKTIEEALKRIYEEDGGVTRHKDQRNPSLGWKIEGTISSRRRKKLGD